MMKRVGYAYRRQIVIALLLSRISSWNCCTCASQSLMLRNLVCGHGAFAEHLQKRAAVRNGVSPGVPCVVTIICATRAEDAVPQQNAFAAGMQIQNELQLLRIGLPVTEASRACFYSEGMGLPAVVDQQIPGTSPRDRRLPADLSPDRSRQIPEISGCGRKMKVPAELICRMAIPGACHPNGRTPVCERLTVSCWKVPSLEPERYPFIVCRGRCAKGNEGRDRGCRGTPLPRWNS